MATRDNVGGTSDEPALTGNPTVDPSSGDLDSESSTITHGDSETRSAADVSAKDGDPEYTSLATRDNVGGTSDEPALTGDPTVDPSSGDLDSESSTITHVDSETRSAADVSAKDGDPEHTSLADQVVEMPITKNFQGRSAQGDWNLLPPEVVVLVLAFLPLHDLVKARLVCRSFRDVLKRKDFQQARGRLLPMECSLAPLVFYVEGGKWHMLGFDYKEQKWRKLPCLDDKSVPIPDMDLFKDYLVSGHGGLFCVNVGKPLESEKIKVFNLLTGLTTNIPPLEFPRHPVVLHLHVTLTKSVSMVVSGYFIIAVGSAATGTENLSRKTEVYDSQKGKWEVAGDVPGTDFSINEHQSGVYCESENVVLVTGFMVNGNKGVLAFDVETRKWREEWLCPFYQLPVEETALPVHFAIAQLVECSGVIYLFSEQEAGRQVTHCIDRLDLIRGGGFTWTRKVTRQRQGYRALLVYPEYTCVPVREHKLCIFNTIERTGVIYNMLDDPINPDVYDSVSASPTLEDGIVFHSLNPVGYAYEPSFSPSV